MASDIQTLAAAVDAAVAQLAEAGNAYVAKAAQLNAGSPKSRSEKFLSLVNRL